MITRAPSHSATLHSAIIKASGFTLVEMNVSAGTRPHTAAHASWASRRRPSTSPANSHPPRVVTSNSAIVQIRIA